MIVVAPLEQEHWKAKSTWSFDFKRKLLDEVSQIMAAKLKMSMASKQSEVTKEEGFVDRIATKIVDNIQVTIKNIHIRFEDDAKG
jgi:vacuolar protein sorting-associated protein 13A/C